MSTVTWHDDEPSMRERILSVLRSVKSPISKWWLWQMMRLGRSEQVRHNDTLLSMTESGEVVVRRKMFMSDVYSLPSQKG